MALDPVSNVDRLVLLLRQRLADRARSAAGARETGGRSPEAPTGADAVRALAAVDGVEERQFRRALVQSLLADHFGSDLINDAGFQQVVERVTETLERDGEGLLSRVAVDLRAAAKAP
jgi:hypothetical protein